MQQLVFYIFRNMFFFLILSFLSQFKQICLNSQLVIAVGNTIHAQVYQSSGDHLFLFYLNGLLSLYYLPLLSGALFFIETIIFEYFHSI